VERAESEREFYFEKLQDIELLCQRPAFAGNPLVRVVEKILYYVDGKPDLEAEVAAALAAAAPAAAPSALGDSPLALPPAADADAAAAAAEQGDMPVACLSPLLAPCGEAKAAEASRAPLSENRHPARFSPAPLPAASPRG
jgi:RP/EB family microtubule-associated protein